MKIVNTTSCFPRCWDSFDTLRRLAAIGYDGIDMAFDYCVSRDDFPFMTDNYESWAYSLRNEAEKLGVSYTHSHAPFDTEAKGRLVERTFKCANILGAKYLVVHPFYDNADGRIYDTDVFVSSNVRAIKEMLEYAEKYKVILLAENLLEAASTPAHTLSRMVEEIDSPWFGWCYDTGHAHATGGTLEEFRTVSRVPLSLHVQDNNGDWDDHLIPGDGNIDWGEFLRSLKSMGYKGDLVLEAHSVPKEAPDEMRDAVLADILDRAKKMVKYYESL